MIGKRGGGRQKNRESNNIENYEYVGWGMTFKVVARIANGRKAYERTKNVTICSI